MTKKSHLLALGLSLMLCGTQALAQTATTAPEQPSNAPEAKQPPLEGANSFTEDQARARIETAGFSRVTDLKMDDRGIWRGTAVKDGKTVNIAMDFKGNVALAQ